MTRLVTHRLPSGTRPAQRKRSHAPVTMEDLATKVMTDFTQRPAITIRDEALLKTAESLMISVGLRLLLVLNEKHTIVGLLSYRDIVGQRSTMAAVREGIRHQELTVSHVMTRLADIETLDFAQVEKANIEELIEHMRQSGRQHALVAETGKDGQVRVRGLFSIVRIGRQLGADIQSGERAHSFSEIEQLLTHA